MSDMTESKSNLIDRIIKASKLLDEAACGSEYVAIVDPSHPLYNTIQKALPNTRISND